MTAEATEPTPAPPPAEPERSGEKASGGMRLLALVLVLALLFAGAVMAVIAINPDDIPRCDQPAEAVAAGECYDITATQETIGRVLAAISAVFAGIAALAGLAVLFTGRGTALMLRLLVVALVLGGLAVLVGRL
jgi:hypothetical protein